jgi:hypothetical protein
MPFLSLIEMGLGVSNKDIKMNITGNMNCTSLLPSEHDEIVSTTKGMHCIASSEAHRIYHSSSLARL